jgi:abortive infection bacteriophage resistance protein
MDYKPYKSFEEQAILLCDRGMTSCNGLSRVELVAEIESRLSYINYYRFSAYWFPFYIEGAAGEKSPIFAPGTHWETICAIYMFDRRLRNLMFDAISRIEIALRTQIAHVWSWYSQVSNPQKEAKNYREKFTRSSFDSEKNEQKPSRYFRLLKSVDDNYQANRVAFTEKHIRPTAKHAKDLHVWEFVEFATFGNLNTLLAQGLPDAVVSEIAQKFGFEGKDKEIFVSCVALLKEVRNACAHQSRIWNKSWTYTNAQKQSSRESKRYVVDILKDLSFESWKYEWNTESQQWESMCSKAKGETLHISKNRTAAVLTVCNILLRAAASRSQWKERLKNLLSGEDVPMPEMHVHLGFSNAHWHEHPLWK